MNESGRGRTSAPATDEEQQRLGDATARLKRLSEAENRTCFLLSAVTVCSDTIDSSNTCETSVGPEMLYWPPFTAELQQSVLRHFPVSATVHEKRLASLILSAFDFLLSHFLCPFDLQSST